MFTEALNKFSLILTLNINVLERKGIARKVKYISISLTQFNFLTILGQFFIRSIIIHFFKCLLVFVSPITRK